MTHSPIAGALPAARILIIDDNRDAAETMARLLEVFGHDVRIAFDGDQAMEIARRQRPDYVLLDLGLPGMDGYEIARRLRRELTEPTVIIAVTGYGQEEDRRRCREAGIDHHRLKPIDLTDLLSLLSTAHPVAGRAAGSGTEKGQVSASPTSPTPSS
jgi:CheY-like chemotaxis protein